MPFWMNWVDKESPIAVTIISIALMLACGFLMTRVTKKLRLPNVTAYIVGGILAGPFCLNLIPAKVIEGASFLRISLWRSSPSARGNSSACPR